MTPGWRRAVLALSLCIACVHPGSAQTTLIVGGGALLPSEGLADVADVGYLVNGGVRRRVRGSSLSLGLVGSFGRAAHGLAGEHSVLYGVAGLVGYTVYAGGPLSVELSGTVGGFSHRHTSTSFPGLDSSRSGLTAGAGTTVWARFDAIRPFVEAAYVRGFGDLDSAAFPTRWVSVVGGVAIPLG